MQFITQPLRSKSVPFDDSDYLYELKYDGFRALAYLENGRCRLVSRNGTTFISFSFLASSIGSSLPNCRAVLDGEIVCLDSQGYPQFNDLLFQRAEPCFFAFDILSVEGRDLRLTALVGRKAELRRVLIRRSANSRVCYAGFRQHFRPELTLRGVVRGSECGRRQWTTKPGTSALFREWRETARSWPILYEVPRFLPQLT